jgi:hypothetical protein
MRKPFVYSRKNGGGFPIARAKFKTVARQFAPPCICVRPSNPRYIPDCQFGFASPSTGALTPARIF